MFSQLADAVIIGGFALLPLGQTVLILLLGLFQQRTAVLQLFFSRFQLGQRVRIGGRALVILGLGVVQLLFGVGKLLFAVNDLLPAAVPFRLSFDQLRFPGVESLLAVGQLLFIVRQFGQAVLVFPLAVSELLRAVGQRFAPVRQLPGGVGQFGLRFLRRLIVFVPGVVDLFLRIGGQLRIPRFAARAGDTFDRIRDRLHRILIRSVQAVQLFDACGGQVNFGIGLVGKILRQYVKDGLHRAAADTGGLALE